MKRKDIKPYRAAWSARWILFLVLGLAAAGPRTQAQTGGFPPVTSITINTIPAQIGAGQSTPIQFIILNYETFAMTPSSAYVQVLKDDGGLLPSSRIDFPPGAFIGTIRQCTLSATITAPLTPQLCNLELQLAKSTGELLGVKFTAQVNVVASGMLGASNLALDPKLVYPGLTGKAGFTVTNSGTTATTAQALQVWASPDSTFWSTRDLTRFGWQVAVGASGGPPPHSASSMAYVQSTGRMVLFGGYNGQLMGDTWEYTPPGAGDQPGWSKLSLTGPDPREGAAMAYDASRNRVILFGGDSVLGPMSDTWEYTPGTGWQQIAITGPLARSYGAMTYDSQRRKVVLFGGGSSSGPLNDLWEYTSDGGWSQVTTATTGAPPLGRLKAGITYDSKRGRILLFSGRGFGQLSDMWQYTPDQGWAQLPTGGAAAREGCVMFYDPKRDRVMLFGGMDAEYHGDTWEWLEGAGWRTLPVLGPPTRSDLAGAYDTARGKFMICGGWDSYDLGDTWELLCAGNDILIGQVDLNPLQPGNSQSFELIFDPAAVGLYKGIPDGGFWVGLVPDALGATRGESGAVDTFIFPDRLRAFPVNAVRRWMTLD